MHLKIYITKILGVVVGGGAQVSTPPCFSNKVYFVTLGQGFESLTADYSFNILFMCRKS